MENIRINKYLSEHGVCSRREADELIAAGRVNIDDRVAVMGDKVSGTERVYVDHRPVCRDDRKNIYILLNKPRGIVCTTKNDKNNVIDYLNLEQRVFPAGRLDKDSEGLLLLTNDGDIVNRMMRARNCHEKEYVVTVDGTVTEDFLKKMSQGIYLEELNATTRSCKVRKTGEHTFCIILTQGLNRQIRRMCQTLGFRVIRLKRIRIMNLKMGTLEVGKWRFLSEEELEELRRQLTGLSDPGAALRPCAAAENEFKYTNPRCRKITDKVPDKNKKESINYGRNKKAQRRGQ